MLAHISLRHVLVYACMAGTSRYKLGTFHAVLTMGVYKYNTSSAGKQATEGLAYDNSNSIWVCGLNPLRQPLIPRYPSAEESC